jgi:hypothetical protein
MPRTVGLEEAVQPFRETGRREVSRLSVRRAQEQKPVMEKALAAIRAASALSVVLTAQGQGADAPCNRDCLVSAAEQYLDALGQGPETTSGRRVAHVTSGWSSWDDGMSDRIQWTGK